MKIIALTVILLLFIKSGWSQNTNLDYRFAVKIYNLTSYEEYGKSRKIDGSTSNHFYYTTKTIQILHPAIAFQWKTIKNNFNEIELTGFSCGKAGTKTEIMNDSTNTGQMISGDELSTTYISARYEYIINFSKSRERKLVPSLGFGINPYYRQNNYSPEISSSFPTSEKYIGFKVFITPRLTYYLSSKLFIDVNIPICFLDNYYLTDKEDNPAIPLQERTTSTVNFSQFPKIFSGRIGIGLKL